MDLKSALSSLISTSPLISPWTRLPQYSCFKPKINFFKLQPSNQPSKNLNQPSQTINQLSRVQDQPSSTQSLISFWLDNQKILLFYRTSSSEVAALPPPSPHTNLQLHSQATGVADKLLLSDFFSLEPFGRQSQRYKVIKNTDGNCSLNLLSICLPLLIIRPWKSQISPLRTQISPHKPKISSLRPQISPQTSE